MTTPAWRAKLRQGSFRGAPFFIRTSDRGTGQRTAKHEFPGRDVGYTEALGRKLRDDGIEVFVSGSDYMTARDALIDACEADGPGVLIHPYYGKMNVVCSDCRIRETADDGGMALFSLKFEEAGALVFPAATANAASAAAGAAANVSSASSSVFSKVFSAAGLTGSALTATQNALNSVTSQVQNAVNAAKGTYQATAAVAFQLKNMQAQITNALNAPAQIAEILNSAIETFNGLGLTSAQVRDAYIGLTTFQSAATTVSATTPGLTQAAANQQAVTAYVQQQALANAVAAAATAPGASYTESASIRDTISSAIDSQLETVTDDTLYIALTQLQTQLALSLPPPNQALGSIVTETPTQTMCALVFLFENFGAIDQESDLLTRNGISNPVFLTANQPLQVLQDASA